MRGMAGVVEVALRDRSTTTVLAELARRAGLSGRIVPRRGAPAQAVLFLPGSRRPHDAMDIAQTMLNLPYAEAALLVTELYSRLEASDPHGGDDRHRPFP